MSVTVHLFSLLAERMGSRALELDVTLPTSTSDLLDELARRYSAIADLRGAVRLAVNREYADPDLLIQDGDEIALITPTSGG